MMYHDNAVAVGMPFEIFTRDFWDGYGIRSVAGNKKIILRYPALGGIPIVCPLGLELQIILITLGDL